MCRSAQGNPRKGEQTLAGVRSPAHFIKELNMDPQVIGQLIASLGFPIVACGALFWFVNKQDTQHNEEMRELRKSIESNTSVLTSLKDLIQVIVAKDK